MKKYDVFSYGVKCPPKFKFCFQHSSFLFKCYVYDLDLNFYVQTPYFEFNIYTLYIISSYNILEKDSRLTFSLQQQSIRFNNGVFASTLKPSFEQSSFFSKFKLSFEQSSFFSTIKPSPQH
jgi:hypothetical protein